MDYTYQVFIAITVLLTASVVLMILLLQKRSAKQSKHMQGLAKDLDLPLHKEKTRNAFIIEGNYKGKAVRIFSFTHGKGSNARPFSAIRILGSNPLQLNFSIIHRTWIQSFWNLIGSKQMKFANPAFNKPIIVKSNKPELMQVLLSETLLSKLVEIQKIFGFKGGIQLTGDTMIYVEHGSISSEHKCKRFEAILDLMCCLRDEIDIYWKRE